MKTRILSVVPCVLILAGCGALVPSTPVAVSTPQASAAQASAAQASAAEASATPAQVSPGAPSNKPANPTAPSYGVLVDLLTTPSSYYANVVGVDGKLWASIKLPKRTPISSLAGHALVLPYVSASSTALYMLAGDSEVLSLRLADGKQATVTHLAVGANMEAAFAVSPDDKQIAVSVLDFNRAPVHVTLYTETLSGANHNVVFESDSNYVWPVAWHSGLLVLAHAYGPFEEVALKAAPAQDDPYWAISYHIVDPATANRVYLLGACTVSGPLSPSGSGSIQGGTIDWRGNVSPWSTNNWGAISSAAALSPDGTMAAAAEPYDPARLAIWRPDGTIATWIEGPNSPDWVGWLDGDHILVGSAVRPDWQPRLVTLSGGPAVFLPVHGFYATRLPTDIV